MSKYREAPLPTAILSVLVALAGLAPVAPGGRGPGDDAGRRGESLRWRLLAARGDPSAVDTPPGTADCVRADANANTIALEPGKHVLARSGHRRTLDRPGIWTSTAGPCRCWWRTPALAQPPSMPPGFRRPPVRHRLRSFERRLPGPDADRRPEHHPGRQQRWRGGTDGEWGGAIRSLAPLALTDVSVTDDRAGDGGVGGSGFLAGVLQPGAAGGRGGDPGSDPDRGSLTLTRAAFSFNFAGDGGARRRRGHGYQRRVRRRRGGARRLRRGDPEPERARHGHGNTVRRQPSRRWWGPAGEGDSLGPTARPGSEGPEETRATGVPCSPLARSRYPGPRSPRTLPAREAQGGTANAAAFDGTASAGGAGGTGASGGAIFSQFGDVTLINLTLAGNHAGNGGAGGTGGRGADSTGPGLPGGAGGAGGAGGLGGGLRRQLTAPPPLRTPRSGATSPAPAGRAGRWPGQHRVGGHGLQRSAGRTRGRPAPAADCPNPRSRTRRSRRSPTPSWRRTPGPTAPALSSTADTTLPSETQPAAASRQWTPSSARSEQRRSCRTIAPAGREPSAGSVPASGSGCPLTDARGVPGRVQRAAVRYRRGRSLAARV